jgi:hypothetical protein
MRVFMITSCIVKATLLTVTFAIPHAMAVDKQNDVFEACPAPSDVHVMPLAAVDALALEAVLALNEAHGLLINAAAVTRPPPSDGWYRLIEQLIKRVDIVDFKQRERRLCVGAAAFLAAEAGYLENHCIALSDDAGHTVVRERLDEIADQVRNAVDALIQHAEHLEEHAPAPLPASTSVSGINVEIRKRSTRPWLPTAALVALGVVYGLIANSMTVRVHPDQVIVLLFMVVPSLFVLAWYLQARHRHRFISFLRTPWKTPGWFYDVTRQAVLLDVRAVALRDLSRRIDLVTSDVAAERQVCESHGVSVAASRLGSLQRQLHDASESTTHLAELVTQGSEEARRFMARCRRDPHDAYLQYGRLPLVLDPAQIETAIDKLVLVLRLTVEVAVDIPLHIENKESRISTVPAGKIAAEAESIFREFQPSARPLKQECRSMLRAFDALHSAVATESLATLNLGRASRITARAAVAASVSTQPTARRPAARTAFIREASTSSNRSRVWIGKATVAAITQRQKARAK